MTRDCIRRIGVFLLALPAMAAALEAGAARVNITPVPTTGVPLSGYESRNDQPSLGLHDSLEARVLVLDDGRLRVALVALDLIGLNPGRLPAALAEAGIDAWLLTATHTHAGPRVLNLSAPFAEDRSWPPASPYLGDLEARVVAGVRQAVDRLQPAQLRVGTGQVDLAFNRRLVHDDGRVEMIWGRNREQRIPYPPVDPEVGVVRVDDVDGEPLALLVNYACHPVVLGGGNRLISADFPGATVRSLEGSFPGAVALFLQGGAGDLDPYVDVQSSFTPVIEQGEVLAREAARVARLLENAAPDVAAGDELRYARRERSVVRHGAPSTRVPVGVEILQVGTRLAFVALPGEPFVDLQLSLKQRSPVRHTFLLGYTNGYAGYLPTRAASLEGGYGASYGHTLHLAAGTGEDLIDDALAVLHGTPTAIASALSTAPARAHLERAHPNPFNAATTLAFELARPTSLVLEIFDVRGTRLRTLVDGRRPAGRHRVTWDGSDDAGRHTATGVYWIRLRLDGGDSQVRKVLLLR